MKSLLTFSLTLAFALFFTQNNYAQTLGKGTNKGKAEKEQPRAETEPASERPTLGGKRPEIIKETPEAEDRGEVEGHADGHDDSHGEHAGHHHGKGKKYGHHKGKGHKYGHHKGKGHKHGHYKGKRHGHRNHGHHNHDGHKDHKPGKVKGTQQSDDSSKGTPRQQKPSIGKGNKG